MPKRIYKPVPWKRNVRKIPDYILSKLDAKPMASMVVGVVKTFPRDKLEAGLLSHLGIHPGRGELLTAGQVCPPKDMGKFSFKNSEGWEVVRRDLPKVLRSFSFEAPHFGDWSKGSHTVSWSREVYQRDYYDAPFFNVIVEPLSSGANGEEVLKFVIDFPYKRNAEAFPGDLLFALNLLQENVGDCNVLSPEATNVELMSDLHLGWEFFPPGTRGEEITRRIVKGMRSPLSPQAQARLEERVKLFESLNPLRLLHGTGGLHRYIGAQFADDLVVFENMLYGNALYVLYEDWEDLSKRSRLEILRQGKKGCNRFPHTDGWQQRFITHIRDEKRRRGIIDKTPSTVHQPDSQPRV